MPDKPWALADGQPWSPLFCFGHGRSYSNYTFVGMAVAGTIHSGKTGGSSGGKDTPATGTLTVTVTVKDLAAFTPAGATVVQVYAAPLSASRTGQVRYKKMLVGFEKAAVAANGETKVTVSVEADDLGYTVYDAMASGAENHPWVVESGEYRLLACRSECDCQLNTTITVL